jgi:hypothetical protein
MGDAFVGDQLNIFRKKKRTAKKAELADETILWHYPSLH